MKIENLTKYICDICGKSECAKKDAAPPMQEIRLPMKYYDEAGGRHELTNQRADVCSECFFVLACDLSERYNMRFIANHGVEIDRYPTEKGGETDA